MKILEVVNVSRSFGGIVAVNQLNMKLEEGKITALIGPNGAGKTTTFNLVTGFLAPTSGEIFFRGTRITNWPPHRIARLGIMRSFQNLRVFEGLSVLNNVILAAPQNPGESLYHLFFHPRRVLESKKELVERALDILNQLQLAQKKDELVKNLSYGEIKLLILARILMADPDVILLDEVLAGLDKRSVYELIREILRLKDMGKTLCVIEHNIDVLKEMSDWTLFLHQGTVIAEGLIDDLMKDSELTQLYFGNPVSERGV